MSAGLKVPMAKLVDTAVIILFLLALGGQFYACLGDCADRTYECVPRSESLYTL